MIAASKGGLLGQLTEVMLRGELVSPSVGQLCSFLRICCGVPYASLLSCACHAGR